MTLRRGNAFAIPGRQSLTCDPNERNANGSNLLLAEELQKLVQNLYKIDPSTLARLKEVLLPK
jgi:hypothetical protein